MCPRASTPGNPQIVTPSGARECSPRKRAPPPHYTCVSLGPRVHRAWEMEHQTLPESALCHVGKTVRVTVTSYLEIGVHGLSLPHPGPH